jgi:YbgC/YbaW family acyl-CoA thioester hydrolase
MQRQDFRFAERLRVRWAEIDAQKIVFNGHYLMYVDTAIAGYWRALAMPYPETLAAMQGDLYVKKATLEYHASARYDEQLEVGIRCERIGTSSMLFSAGVFRGENLLVSGEVVYVFADPHTQTSRPVPDALRTALRAFEAGEDMVEVTVGRWAELGDRCGPLRVQVLGEELGLGDDLAYDLDDGEALHALAVNRFGLAVATGRLLAPAAAAPSESRLSRMAVLPLVRGVGIGARVFDALCQAARSRGDRAVLLHSTVGAVPFYRRLGCTPVGSRFVEAGIPHQTMRRSLLDPPNG